MKQKPMVLNTSDEAAKLVTVTGWVDRDGRFWGNDERMARWSGATHIACQKCGTPHEKLWTLCNGCRDLAAIDRWEKLERKEWDHVSPVCLFDGDEFFFDLESFLDWCADHDVKPHEARLVHCKPQYLSQVDTDHWADELAEDGELPPEIEEALEEFNAKIRAQTKPCSWWASNIAVDPASLAGLEAA